MVSILGIASAVPELEAPPSRFDDFARKWAKPSKPLDKTLFINGHTQIQRRASIHDEESDLINRPQPPPIQDICDVFSEAGVSLAKRACDDAIRDWGRPSSEITHLICTTCTGSSHPGYDLLLHQRLGLRGDVERTLLHGIGCSGGLAILRLARQVCLATEAMGQKARVLIVALEVASSMLRTELQSIDEEAERGGKTPNIASVIFSDAASAMIVGTRDLEEDGDAEDASFEVLECISDTVPETAGDLGFNIRENGWRAILTPRVPELVGTAVPITYERLLKTMQKSKILSSNGSHPPLQIPPNTPPNEFDWFIHTGGSLILDAVSEIMNLDKACTAASWERYKERGNSSSASIGGVIERGREMGGKELAVACSFGPGITVEMCLLRRCEWQGGNGAVKESNGTHQVDGVNGKGITGLNGTNGVNHSVTGVAEVVAEDLD